MVDRLCPIHQHARETPDKIAIESSDCTLTYRQLDAAISNHCSKLKTLSIQPGTHIAFVAKTSAASVLLLFALFRLKAIACPLSFRTPPEQLPSLVQQCSASHLLNAEDLPIETTSFLCAPPTYALEQLAAMLMTSGSSGKPKAACHTIGAHFANAEGAIASLRCTSESRWLLSLPLFHVGGMAILFRIFLAGGTIVLTDKLLFSALEQQRITHASFVPTQLFRFLQEPQEMIGKIAESATCLLIGGAPLSPSLAQKAFAHRLPLFTAYGMTEMSSMITLAEPHEIDKRLHMGKQLPFRSLRIDENGEILVRGQTLFSGYWDPVQQKPILPTLNGWLPTKDLGSLDDQGQLTLHGRKDRMFISGGENIQPEEVEAALCQIPGILAAHVIPTDDLEFGKRPIAYLLEDVPEHTLESVRAALKGTLPSFKHPVKIFPYTHEMKNGLKVVQQKQPF
ncbi:MAG: o-succinylbenzoate--CoA ligase [Parachlamydiales bacterium]|nr:o-succinylbenzoate--CoA ligase [Candidatus Acheromyda pituitae]